MGAKLSEIAGIILQKLGGAQTGVLDQGDAFGAAKESLAFYRHQQTQSGRYLEGAHFDQTPSQIEFNVDIQQGFVESNRVERLINDLLVQWAPVNIVGIDDLEHEARIGNYAIAFFGQNPMMARISWDPTIEIWNTLRVWYDKLAVEPTTRDTDSGIGLNIMKYLIATYGAIILLPILARRDKKGWDMATVSGFEKLFTAQIQTLTAEWENWRLDSGKPGFHQTEAFNSERRGGYPSRRIIG